MLCCLVYTRLGWSVSFFWSLAPFSRHSVFLFCLRVLCMFVLFNCLFRLLTVWSYCDVDFVVFLVLLLLCWFMFSVFLSLPSIFSLSSYHGFVIRVISTFGVTSGDKFRVLICGDGSCHRRITGVLGNICLFCLYLFSVLSDLLLCGHPSCHLLILPLVCFLSVVVCFNRLIWLWHVCLLCLGCVSWFVLSWVLLPVLTLLSCTRSRVFSTVRCTTTWNRFISVSYFPFSFCFYSCICFLFLFSLFVCGFLFICVSLFVSSMLPTSPFFALFCFWLYLLCFLFVVGLFSWFDFTALCKLAVFLLWCRLLGMSG